MSQVLRQSTQIIVVIGPFVDVSDGFTPEVGITLGAADEAEILKSNTTTTTDISAATWAAISGCDGWYGLTLTTSHTDTIGPLTVMVNDDSVCLPVFARFQVIEEAAYDTIFAASALPASTTNITAGTVTTATNVTTVNGLAANVITAASIAADAITDAKVAADVTIASVTGAVGSVTGNVGGNVNGSVGSVTAGVTVTTNNDKTGYGLSATAVDEIWDEPTAGHSTAGTTGEALTDAGSAGDPWSTALPGAYGVGSAGKIIGDNLNTTVSSRASQTSLDTVDDFLDTEVAAIKAKTDQLTFTVANQVDANIQYVNDVQVTGTGAPGSEWGP